MRVHFLAMGLLATVLLGALPAGAEDTAGDCQSPVDRDCCAMYAGHGCQIYCAVYWDDPVAGYFCVHPPENPLPPGWCHHMPQTCIRVKDLP